MKKILVVFACCALAVQTGAAQRTIRMNLERLIQDAGIIIRGTVTAVESRPDKQTGYRATFVTLRVDENFYGAPDNEVTFKVYAGRSGKVRLADMPRFAPGEEVYSMWYKPSAAGFSSPVGMGQGKFSMSAADPSGKRYVKNGVSNRSLFTGMKHGSALAKGNWMKESSPQVEVSDFESTVRSLVSILKKR